MGPERHEHLSRQPTATCVLFTTTKPCGALEKWDNDPPERMGCKTSLVCVGIVRMGVLLWCLQAFAACVRHLIVLEGRRNRGTKLRDRGQI